MEGKKSSMEESDDGAVAKKGRIGDDEEAAVDFKDDVEEEVIVEVGDVGEIAAVGGVVNEVQEVNDEANNVGGEIAVVDDVGGEVNNFQEDHDEANNVGGEIAAVDDVGLEVNDVQEADEVAFVGGELNGDDYMAADVQDEVDIYFDENTLYLTPEKAISLVEDVNHPFLALNEDTMTFYAMELERYTQFVKGPHGEERRTIVYVLTAEDGWLGDHDIGEGSFVLFNIREGDRLTYWLGP